MSTECHKLHQIANGLEIKTYPFTPTGIPKNGIYIFFEKGETAHSGNRIVRIGINRGQGNLYQRLREHYEKRNKDRSIFRKNLGFAILNNRKDSFINLWKVDLTPHVSRLKYKDIIKKEDLLLIEDEVSQVIQRSFCFVTIPIDNKIERQRLEAALISTVAHCEECGPSVHWFGLKSPNKKIRETGLWQVQSMNGPIINLKELEKLEQFSRK